jgi:hypothetical protein
VSTFTLDISRFVEKAKGNVDQVVRKIALTVFQRVIMKSPVDTGRFRGNWQVAIGTMPSGVLAGVDKSGGATIQRVAATALNMKAGEVIYLMNNLAYARALEYGHSKQAPNGMVRITVAEFQSIVNRVAK